MENFACKWVHIFLLFRYFLFPKAHSEILNGMDKVRGVNLGGWLVVEGWIKPSLFDGIPNGDMLDGTQVQFKSVVLQKYISAENGGGLNVSVNRESPSLWETFRLWRVSEAKFQFRSFGGQFLSCDGEGSSVSVMAESPSTTETFHIERNNNSRVHIRLLSGAYLQATSSYQLTADYPGKPGWDDNMATFEMTIVSNNLHGDYQLANGYGHDKAKEVLTMHRSSFITADDFNFLSKHGINTVRIPVGWWISLDPNPPAPFVGGALVALDNAFSYAKNPALLGIELLNEPSVSGVPLNLLVSYYSKGYQTVRKYSSTAYVIICQRIGNTDPLELFKANIGSSNIVVDLHYYNLFDNLFDNMSAVDNIEFIYKSRKTQLQALNSANGPLTFIGEWVNEMSLTNGSQFDYQDFGRAQLEVYSAASFGWAYWTLKNDRKHWDYEWNIQNKYLQLGDSPSKRFLGNTVLLALSCACYFLHHIS